MHDEYDLGAAVTVVAEFHKRIAGVLTLTTPTTTTLKYRRPVTGDVITKNNADLTTVSTGIKSYDIITDEPGDWWYEFTGTGNMDAVKEGMFRVKPSLVP